MNITPTYLAEPKRYDQMKYNRCGKSGIHLPAISLGLWHNFGGSRFVRKRARHPAARL